MTAARHTSRHARNVLRLLAAGLVIALVAPSVAVARPLLPAEVTLLGARSGVAVSHQVVVTWERARLGATRAQRLSALGKATRTSMVSGAAGAEATFVRSFGTSGTVGVYRFAQPLGKRAGRTIDEIAQLPGVVKVEPDPWITAGTIPNDGNASLVWGALGPGDATAYGTATYGINADDAWATTSGSGVRVAVIDTGWVNHTDLAGQSLAGYDFISDAWTANDGGGRDADPTDAGDWIDAAEALANPGCPERNSSWHGMHVSGTIAALANNGLGTFGAAYGARILPLRTLGKCGGSMTDIADAVTWAYGGTVAGVAANANPVDVINMSLGGAAACPSYMQTAITNARAAGVVVAVAAGNESMDASASAPANCSGSLVVAATDIAGKRATFSNYGPIVDIAAPGVTIASTYNNGTMTPVASPGGDALAGMNGTSMATPHVAALAALLMEDNPTAQPAAIEYAITHGVTTFPADATAHGCSTANTCGSGIANVPAALASLAAIDTAAPTATVTRPAQFSNAAAPVWTATFDESVTGLQAGDFARTGTATGCVVGTPAGSGPSWTVSVSGCSAGTITLTLAANSVADAIGNTGPALAASAAEATIDRTAPISGATIDAAVVASTAMAVGFTVSDATSGVASITGYYSTSAGLTSPTACGTAPSPASSGSFTCTLPGTSGTYHVYTRATDGAGNVEAAPGTADGSVVLDLTAPTVTITAPSTPTAAATLTYGLTFSESVSELAASDLSVSGTATGCTVEAPGGSGTGWSVVVAGCSSGTVSLTLGATTVVDALGNRGPVDPVTADTVVIDRTVPAVSTFVLQASSDTGRSTSDARTAAAVLVYDLVFSQSVTGLADGDVLLPGDASACAAAVAGEGATYTVTLTGCPEGVIGAGIASGSVTSGVNQGPPAPAAGTVVTVDRTAPVLVVSSAPASGGATTSPAITLSLASDEPLDCGTVTSAANVDLASTGATLGTVTGSGTDTCTIPATAAIADGQEGTATIARGAAFSVADDAGNTTSAVSGLPVAVRVDRRAPAVIAGSAAAAVTAAQPSYTISFSESVSALAAADLVIDPASTATGCVIGTPVEVPASWATAYTIALAGCSQGTVRLVLGAGTVLDVVGHAGPAGPYTLPAVMIDTVRPVVTPPVVTPRVGQKLAGTAVPVTVAWTSSDTAGSGTAGSGTAAYALSRSTDGVVYLPVATVTGTAYTTTVPTAGTVRFKVVATDRAGNVSTAAATATSASLVQQAKATYARTWATASSSSFSGGSARWSKTSGASATYTFTGKGIAFVTTKSSTRGKVRIYVNGTLQGTYDLKATATAYRTIAWQRTWSTSAKRTVKVVVLATSGRPRVDVDAFVVLR